MAYNDTLVRDYARLFYDYARLFLRLFHRLFCDYFTIIRDYFTEYTRLFHGFGTRKMGMCRQQFLTQSWRNGCLVYEERLHICIDWMAHRQNGKLPDGAFLHYYTHSCFLLYALFVLAE
jgi:hypothetical protein